MKETVATTGGARFDEFDVMRPARALSMQLPVELAKCIRRARTDVVHVKNASWYEGLPPRGWPSCRTWRTPSMAGSTMI